jgi:hypothetical protein
MKKIKIIKIVAEAEFGADIGGCLKEAIVLSATEWQNVHLIHNNTEYIVRPNDLLNSIESVKK